MNNISWAWPLCESMHFTGLSLLVGTVGFFDLRLLGFARRAPIAALHRLIPIGVGGFAMNAATGFCFLAGAPDQYFINAAFQIKVAFFLIAGVNVAVFYLTMFRSVREVGPGEQAPLFARLIGGVSLCSWIDVMTAGRLLTFYRPLS
ncbi:MAG: hypothetical protein EXQ53_12330 [Acidobacteria bacterium]|nr:hypothetical protein [Acidobacteriota bacterium]